MQSTSLVSAFISAQVGQLQLAAAGYMARTTPESGPSVAQLVDAAEQNFDPLTNVAAGIGTNVNVIA